MTTPERINHDYLSQLILISKEQQETDLIAQLMRTLQSEQTKFLNDPPVIEDTPAGRKAQQERLHRLKNVYFNLGCEHVGHILEEMNQALKSEDESIERFPKLWEAYKTEAHATLEQLRFELKSLCH